MIIIVVIIFSLRFARLAPNPYEWDLSVGLVYHKENAVGLVYQQKMQSSTNT